MIKQPCHCSLHGVGHKKKKKKKRKSACVVGQEEREMSSDMNLLMFAVSKHGSVFVMAKQITCVHVCFPCVSYIHICGSVTVCI